MHHEKSELQENSYAETSFDGRNVTDDEIQRRLEALINPTTGLLSTTKVGLFEQLLREEDKKKEIDEVQDIILKIYPSVDWNTLGIIRFSTEKLWLLLLKVLRLERPG